MGKQWKLTPPIHVYKIAHSACLIQEYSIKRGGLWAQQYRCVVIFLLLKQYYICLIDMMTCLWTICTSSIFIAIVGLQSYVSVYGYFFNIIVYCFRFWFEKSPALKKTLSHKPFDTKELCNTLRLKHKLYSCIIVMSAY